MAMNGLFVSVVVPVYKDYRSLETCLDALLKQDYRHDLYEIIVVDNSPDELADRKLANDKRVSFVEEHQTGSYRARNRGLMDAKGEVIAFTDADCVPEGRWLNEGVKALYSCDDCGLVAGRICLTVRNSNAPSLIEYFELRYAFPQRVSIEKHKFGVTANLFTTREVIDRVGPFDPELMSSGDREWGNRVAAAGFRLVYAEDAIVAHPARHRYKQLVDKTRRVAGGQYILETRHSVAGKPGISRWISCATPPVTRVVQAMRSNVEPVTTRVGIAALIVVLKYVSLYERLRVALGGEPLR